MNFVEVNGVGLRCELTGGGNRTVVLIHEMGGSLESWDEVAPRLAASRRVLRYDTRGAGHTGPPPDGRGGAAPFAPSPPGGPGTARGSYPPSPRWRAGGARGGGLPPPPCRGWVPGGPLPPPPPPALAEPVARAIPGAR